MTSLDSKTKPLPYVDETEQRIVRLEKNLWMYRALAWVNAGVALCLLVIIAYWIIPRYVLR